MLEGYGVKSGTRVVFEDGRVLRDNVSSRDEDSQFFFLFLKEKIFLSIGGYL